MARIRMNNFRGFVKPYPRVLGEQNS